MGTVSAFARRRLLLLAAVGGLSPLSLVGCGGGETTIGFTGAAARPPGPLDASSGKVTLKANEFFFDANEIDAKAGKVAVTLRNVGTMPHEMVLLKTDAKPSTLPGKGGRAAETGLVDTLPPTRPSGSRTKTFRLSPGRYVFLCNIVGHYASGMYGQVLVK